MAQIIGKEPDEEDLKIPNKTFPITHMRDESRTRIERLGGNLYQCYNQLLEEVEKVKESPLELFLPQLTIDTLKDTYLKNFTRNLVEGEELDNLEAQDIPVVLQK